MGYDVQFVDSIASSPATRLNLGLAPWTVRSSTHFGAPALDRAAVSNLMVDGERYPAAAYRNRTITLVVQVNGVDDDTTAVLLQQFYRELDRPANILRYRPGTTSPVFFRTFRAAAEDIEWSPINKEVTARIPARPFAVGLKETLPAALVYNDPAEGTTANANPFFEVDASTWTGTGGTAVRSTAQAHEGAASLLLTPDGVTATVDARSETVAATVGTQYRASAWVRCAVARNVSVNINWRTSGGTLLSTSSVTVAVAATTWTLLQVTGTAPASTGLAQMTVSMGSTPPAGHTLHIDEARLRQAGGVGGACFDISGIKGDVETPLFMRLGTDFIGGSDGDTRGLVVGIRRRGTPSAAPLLLQAESMGLGTETALAAATDSAMSGAGLNYVRVTPTNTDMNQRVLADPFPTVASVDVRGRYRVLARVRQSDVLDQWALQFAYGPNAALPVRNDAVTTSQNTNPRYVDLGTVQFPFGDDPVTDGMSGVEVSTQGVRISVWARRLVGSGTLDIDCLLFVPADDSYTVATIYCDGLASAAIIDADQTMVYAVGGSGEIRAPFLPSVVTSAFPLVSPGVTNRIVFVRDGGKVTDSALTATSTVTPSYYPQYAFARGVTT